MSNVLLILVVLLGQGRVPKIETRSLERAGEPTIHYSIAVPETYSPDRPVPLVLALHFSGNPEGAGRSLLEILVAPGLKELGAVLVAPDRLGGVWTSEANDRALNVLCEELFNTYEIDRRKIAITGYSMGATGAWQLAQKHPDRFSAVIPISGMPPAAMSTWRIPVFAIHSRSDEVVLIGPTQAAIAQLRKNNVRAELIPLIGPGHYQTYFFVDALKQAVPWLKEIWK